MAGGATWCLPEELLWGGTEMCGTHLKSVHSKTAASLLLAEIKRSVTLPSRPAPIGIHAQPRGGRLPGDARCSLPEELL